MHTHGEWGEGSLVLWERRLACPFLPDDVSWP